MRRVFLAFSLATLGLFATSALQGWELGGSKRGRLPKEARQAQGGYRSYNYWRGGK